MIDFSDPSSYRGINSDDLAIYVKLEQAHLNREIENVLGEGGTFSTHSTDEFARLQEDFNSAYESYVKGLALTSMGWYRTPMVPGGPDPMTFAKIAGSIALTCSPLGPWGAFAFNAMLTGVDVADGTTAWKHAAVQMGVGAAAAYTGGMGGQLINIAASGIDYEEGGGIGWDNAQFKKGVVRGVATMVLTPALGGAMGEFGKTALGTGLSTGLTTFATNSLTAGDGWSIGWDGGNWQQHLTEGVASGVTAAIMQGARGKQGKDAQGKPITGTDKQPQPNVFGDSFANKAISGAINSSIMTLGYHAFGGEGFENSSFSMFNWNSMAYSAQDLGGFLGNKANGWVLNHYGIDKDTGVRTGNRENDSWFDKAASYLHEGAIKIDNGIKGFFNNVGKMVGDGIRNVAQSVKSIFPEYQRQFFTKEQREEFQRKYWQRGRNGELSIIEKSFLKNNYKDLNKVNQVDDLLYNFGVSAGDRGMYVQIAKELNDVDNYTEKIKNGKNLDNREVVDYVNKKARLDRTIKLDEGVNSADVLMLMRSLHQKLRNGPIVKEIAKVVEDNAELFKKRTPAFNNNKHILKQLNPYDKNSVNEFAQKVAYNACKLTSTYALFVLSGVEGVPGSFGDFYETLYKNNQVNYLDMGSIQGIANSMFGKNVLEFNYLNGSGSKLLANIYNQSKNFTYGQVHIEGHYMMVRSPDNEKVNLWDTGYPNSDSPRDYGVDLETKRYVNQTNIRSFLTMKVNKQHQFYRNNRR